MTRKSRATLDQLDDSAQDAVFEFVESHTLKVAAKWLKDEYDITISPGRLAKWASRRRADVEFASLLDRVSADRHKALTVGKAVGDSTDLTQANIALLSQALFEALQSDDDRSAKSSAKLLASLIEALAKDRKSKADVLSAETGRDKFQFDAAKVALEKAGELQRINESAGNEREKIERAVTALFGPAPKEVAA